MHVLPAQQLGNFMPATQLVKQLMRQQQVAKAVTLCWQLESPGDGVDSWLSLLMLLVALAQSPSIWWQGREGEKELWAFSSL